MYDVIIIGGGPAGLTAALFAGRYRLKTLVIAKEIGGLLNEAAEIENWPGIETISGMDLMKKIGKHAGKYAEIKEGEVGDLQKKKDKFIVVTKNKKFESKSLIFAMGSVRRRLNIPGEEDFLGRGISYCGTCEAALFKNKMVGVVGGSDSAAKTALLLSKYAKHVFIIYRKEKIRAVPINAKRVYESKKITVINNTNVVEVKGNKFVEKVVLDKPYKGNKEFKLSGLFIEIGEIPATALAKRLGVKLTEKNEIKVNKMAETNVAGVFAAGDITDTPLRQAITASAEGAIAALSAYNFVGKKS